MKSTAWSSGLSVTGDGAGVVAHSGSVAVRLVADRVGLTGALSAATTRGGFSPVHDRGRVLVDVATMVAAGGEAIADIDTLRHQVDVLGPVASAPTVWRALDELKTHQRGPRTILRSKSPDLVLQEIWGHLCCHYAIRALMTDAAVHTGHDPDRVSFVAALRITRATLAQPGAFPP